MDKLIQTLKDIDSEVQWYRVCCGAVSQDDMHNMLKQVVKSVDSVRNIVYLDENEPDGDDDTELSNDF